MKPTAWVIPEFESIDAVEGKKKYILGAKVSGTRPFESAAKFISDFTLKNQSKYTLCLAYWLAKDGVKGETEYGCQRLIFDMPVEQTKQAISPKPILLSYSGASTILSSGAAILATYMMAF